MMILIVKANVSSEKDSIDQIRERRVGREFGDREGAPRGQYDHAHEATYGGDGGPSQEHDRSD